MNTEINFLEKQPNKFAPFVKFGIVFIILILCVLALILVQKNNYQGQIEAQTEKLAQLENTLKKNHSTMVGEQQLQQLSTDLQTIKSTRIPKVHIYQNILGLLPNPKQLFMYENAEAKQIIVGANFKTLPDVAAYVSALLKQNYIKETELTSINFVKSVYQATLTISIDSKTLVKGPGSHE